MQQLMAEWEGKMGHFDEGGINEGKSHANPFFY
jgi:hypothetical protein